MLSPFSIEQPWSLHWQRLPSNLKTIHYVNDKSPKECAALDAIAEVGIIGGRQLARIFRLPKKRQKQMVREQKIVRHEVHVNKQIIPVYTLGQTGAVITDVPYEPNYWVVYQIRDVLKRVLFFELYQYFHESTIMPAPEPFVGAIELNGKPFYIYVSRGDVQDLLMYLKWKGRSFSERLIVITESMKHIEPLKMYAEDMKLRVTTDQDLMAGKTEIQNVFYFLGQQGEFVKEA
ncbi:hypothetical protein [Lentibacillus amyloliquefaciens]|uniref:Uncharacterized protein n=1 Tax=Lentibacillus amyloliquefaciens TaxID=1472767 RepID=A0A0U4EWI1_9BACI|nr:hypothetical protein [Lentibacillus amyloliquefaciens]ALX47719.1 hypothetical protein AOX59_03330 [Lentibacillus amyloliquefaciens]